MKQSAGILLYRTTGGVTEVFLVHPGGPFFAKKDEGWWTVPKGELLPGELPLDGALREFEEEIGYKPEPPFLELEPVVQKAGKQVLCWAAQGSLDAATIICNTFEIEWPPKSGRRKQFPEVDKAGWYTLEQAELLINDRQAAFLEQLRVILKI